MPAGTTGVCGTMATSRARSRRRRRAPGVPKREMAPATGSRPPTARNRVDLPAPFGPITVTHSPAATSRMGAEAGRLVVADAEYVEYVAVGQHGGGRDGGVRQEQQDVVPAGRGQAPEQPGVDLADRVRVALLQVRLTGGEEAGHRDAGQDQRGRRAVAGPGGADRVGHRDGDEGAGERGDREGEWG